MSDHAPAPELAPGEQAPALTVQPATLRLARLALWVWLLLALLLWLGSLFGQSGMVSLLSMPRRLWPLWAPGLLFVVAPLLVWPLAARWTKGGWRFGLDIALRIGAISQLVFGVAWTGAAVLALADFKDPLESLPWVFPPYLEDFARRHPQIEVIPIFGVRTVHLRAAGVMVDADGNDLVDAEVSLTPCTPPPSAAQLGGLAMPDGLQCESRLAIRRPTGQRVTWLFRMPRAAGLEELRRHFEAWAKTQQAELRISGYKDYRVEAHNTTRRWDLLIQLGRNDTRVLVPEGGATLSWRTQADSDDAEPTR